MLLLVLSDNLDACMAYQHMPSLTHIVLAQEGVYLQQALQENMPSTSISVLKSDAQARGLALQYGGAIHYNDLVALCSEASQVITIQS